MHGLRPFFRYFEFSGRSGMAEFWQYMAYMFIASVLLSLLEYRAILESAALGIPRMPIWSTILSVLTFIPGAAVMFRRLHDRNKSGWLVGGWYLFIAAIIVVALIGAATSDSASESAIWPLLVAMFVVWMIVAVYITVQLALPGDDFENDYGPPDNEPFTAAAAFGSPSPRRQAPAARPTQGTAASHASADDTLGRIERLAELHSKGHLTDEEFAGHKAKLLQGLA